MDDTKPYTVYLITCIQKQSMISVRKESDWHLYSRCMCVWEEGRDDPSHSVSPSRAEGKILNESGQKLGAKQSHSWFLASNLFTRPPCCASGPSVDAHMCCDGQEISIYSKQREKTPYHAHWNESLIHKHKLSAHIHNFSDGWSVTCRPVSQFALWGLLLDTQFVLQRLLLPSCNSYF